MPEADAEIRAPHIDDEIANCGLLVAQPWILVFFPHILGPTHDEHEVEWLKIGVGSPSSSSTVCQVRVLSKEVAKNAGMLDGYVLEDKNFHGRTFVLSLSKSNPSWNNEPQTALFRPTPNHV